MEVVTKTAIKKFPLIAQDKSRDVYDVADDKLLVVYTDRMDAYGVTLDKPLPYKGIMLNQITNFWMNKFARLTNNYRITSKLDEFSELAPYASMLEGRSVLVKKIKPMPIQFMVVGSISGDLWPEYKETGEIGGQRVPRGLEESEWLEQPVVVPVLSDDSSVQATENPRRWAQRVLGQKLFHTVEETCLAAFGVARNFAMARDLTLAKTYLEFGVVEGKLYALNELMTPDVSTYWPGDILPGESKFTFERQNLYGWLKVQRWEKGKPVPDLPPELLKETEKKYRHVFNVMVGKVATLKKQEEEENAAAAVNVASE